MAVFAGSGDIFGEMLRVGEGLRPASFGLSAMSGDTGLESGFGEDAALPESVATGSSR